MGKKRTKNHQPTNNEVKQISQGATIEMPALSAEPLVTQEVPVQSPSTQEFNAVSEKKEAPVYELVRTSSGAYAKACKKFSWFGLHNTHLIVYTTFFLALSVFAVYYGFFQKDKMLCIFASLAAVFMLYVVACGPRLFASGMAFDEERAEGTLNCLFYTDKLVIECGSNSYTAPYTAVTKLAFFKHFIYIRIKNSKDFPNGIIMEKPVNKETTIGIINLLKQEGNISEPKKN
ncbi:MAG: hypothetical protein IJB65_02545 [Clostridia bacterium]|nr:hypothetical protein [Clostridia bacterium]